jgi:hypothetical protein
VAARAFPAAALAAAALVLAACGGADSSPEGVVRAWAESVRLGDAEAAARLIAPGAEVVDGARTTVLRTEADALRYSRNEACAGGVVRIEQRGGTVEAEFDVRGAAPRHCGGAAVERTLFRVRDGRITLLHRLPERGRVRIA